MYAIGALSGAESESIGFSLQWLSRFAGFTQVRAGPRVARAVSGRIKEHGSDRRIGRQPRRKDDRRALRRGARAEPVHAVRPADRAARRGEEGPQASRDL